MSWCWLALLPEPPTGAELADALASATATDLSGRPAGLVAAWPRGRKPLRSAVRVDERVIDAAGPAAWVSLVLVPPEVAPLFDDPAVSQALRRVLAGPPFAATSTLVRDAVHLRTRSPSSTASGRRGWPTTPSRARTRRGSCGLGRACSAGSPRRPARRSSATAASPGPPPDSTTAEPASRSPSMAWRYSAPTPSRSASQRDCQRRSTAKPPGAIASAACAAT